MLSVFLFFTAVISAASVATNRVDTMLSFLPAIHKMDRAGIRTNDTYTYINDSETYTFLVRTRHLIDDQMFESRPTTLRQTVGEIIVFLNSTVNDNDEPVSFSYPKLLSVLVGSFEGMLKEIEKVIKRGNRIEIK